MKLQALEKFCEKNSIGVITFQKAAELLNDPNIIRLGHESKGVASHSLKTNHNIILYDDTLQAEEQYFTFAHEIAHHALEHMTKRIEKRNAAEAEADVFASVLMALSVFAEIRV